MQRANSLFEIYAVHGAISLGLAITAFPAAIADITGGSSVPIG